MVGGAALVVALLCAAAMGLAIQRGSTCAVAAVEEWRSTRRFTRLAAMLEASLWVCAVLLLARHWGHPMALPAGYAVTRWTLAGAALLGAGAAVNQACVMGTVARLGSGQWAYAATPLGFYLACLSAPTLFAPPAPMALGTGSPLGAVPAAASWVFPALALALALRRGVPALRRRGLALNAPWSPHAATTVIGIAFAALLLAAGTWAYTDVLAELARGMAHSLPARLALCAALLLGALAGGHLSGKLKWEPVRPAQGLRCAGGGLLMGWGSALIPGGNDGLVLMGLPMLWPYAWVAFGVMLAVIAAALHALAQR
ncbi:hypothetical protein BurJ1DRAFT_3416 [Burkholderiales bacterium JOSHI_001]|nr:hypothetical protein BurJ1DRAFT_3416 [Burkholderiales bacterium JOSHI_001]